MDLILWRHAEAEDATDKVPDSKRRLTSRGEKQARLMARWLREYVPKRQLRILSSPAQRAQMTALALGLPFEVERKLCGEADAADLLAAVQWPNRAGTTIVVGHQPVLGIVASLLLSGTKTSLTMKTGCIWWFSRRSGENGQKGVLRAVIDPRFLKIRKADMTPALRGLGMALGDGAWMKRATLSLR